jgi:hypothetical protein
VAVGAVSVRACGAVHCVERSETQPFSPTFFPGAVAGGDPTGKKVAGEGLLVWLSER